MVQINIEYLGDLHCKLKHGPSGQEFLTDAPVDNQGKGEYFSPTDLAATAMGSCIATIMGIKSREHNIDIKGMKITVLKEMMNQPYRRIKKLMLDVVFPYELNEHDFTIMKNVIKTCPVTRSLHPDIEIEVEYRFAEINK
ncbi:MAG: osmotically inducible protein OsmC [Ignavibacteria bacterium GWB2_35_12]|nr:MAG: osmotically inducible protein OsmC [Ignavibacteria bacterium GWA2_35_8]OGU40603.1 MAG: osmotically inducible protein OsmC [Ignavibacteria bacterium GWB2_35_12]OGU91667.1 MAG: osmotically inducible protein OsmC [Ignavibacteria bacterium RIFOXYA2_FULL_35_10]OGV22637.1 MAG: osmotically inducible protein OsmC [Ignavibacteria bacterium RIFOXYC2_FULL_35_21]